MNKYITLLLLTTFCFFNLATAENLLSARDHAPIGVMGDHTHPEGDLMLSYRYMFMNMDGNRNNNSGVSDSNVLSNYMVTPKDMDMEMHMLGAMYALTDDLTIMTMFPILNISMNHQTRMGGSFQTQANGLGDISLSALYSLIKNRNHTLHINAGISLPTGEINERDDTPMGSQVPLPYPMQLGSGTYDLMPGITYNGFANLFSWGAQALGTVRLGDNSNDYTLGDRFESSVWLAFAPTNEYSTSLRLNWNSWGNIDGRDERLNPMMIPTADPDLRGGERLDIGIGLNTLISCGALEGLRLAIEYLFPVYQHLDGPQLETDGSLIVGAQMTF